MQDHSVKQLGRISIYRKCIGGCLQGDSAGSNPRLCLKKKENFISIDNIPILFLYRSRQKSIAYGPELPSSLVFEFGRTLSSQSGEGSGYSFSASNDDGSPGDEYVALTDAFLAHFRPTINTTSERHKFRQLKQGPEESVSTFVGRLRERVDLCKFGATDVDSVVNSQVRDQLVASLKSPEVRHKLLKESTLTHADAITKAVALETSYADSKLYDPPAEPANQFSSVAAVNATRQQRRQPRTVSGSCKYCGRTHAKGKSFCPAANIRCRSCSKVGHFAAVCQSQRSGLDANAVDEEPADLADQAHLVYDTVYMAEQTGSHRQFLASLLVDGKECEGLLDTGASHTILTDDIVQLTRSTNRVLKAYTVGEIATLGMADVTIASPTRTMSCSCFVVPHGKHRILFNQDVISELELMVPAHLVDTGNLVDTAPISISVDDEARPVA